MAKKRICIIGCGTYGSYLIKRLQDLYLDKIEIIVVDLGNEKTQSAEEVGVFSKSENSKAANFGRYFGLGGTSARWGGQVLFFDERDNPTNDADWNHIVNVNDQYKSQVSKLLLGGDYLSSNNHEENPMIKTGCWLKYSKRNLYKLFNLKKESLTYHLNYRVTKFNYDGSDKIKSIAIKNKSGETKTIEADMFYLTAGALESCRLLMINMPELYAKSDLGKNFGDHISIELFKILSHKPIMFDEDLTPLFYKGSLVTKRMIVESSDKRIGFAHPIFNKDVKAFSALKSILFGKQSQPYSFKEIVTGLGFLAKFGFSVFVLKKMAIYNNDWSIQLDLEQDFPNDNSLTLNDDIDSFGERGITLNWKVNQSDREMIEEVAKKIESVIIKNGYNYERIYSADNEYQKIEDTYHPVGFLRMGTDMNAVINHNNTVKGYSNLYHFSTGVFKSAKSINPTAAAFCLIEDHLEKIKNHI